MTTHYLDHPERGETKVLNGWSYLGGALLGPLYVLYHRFTGPALLMLVYSIASSALMSHEYEELMGLIKTKLSRKKK